MIELTHIESGPPLNHVRELFLDYERSLDFSLCFQNFDQELAALPGVYNRPQGRLILCTVDGRPAGCIALKELEPGVSEMKRLFVRPEFRGRQLGLKLAQHIIDEARGIGYSFMRLDTIRGKMENAIAMYESLGFKEIPAYYDSPIPNALYMELDLR
jgi:GNAT superfamily N-acetyltransferase